MIKKSIAYYTEDHQSLSLRDVPLKYGKKLEDLFYALSDSQTFKGVTRRLYRVVKAKLHVEEEGRILFGIVWKPLKVM